ncbi:hypothetical protein SAMN02746065_11586 [Desulfocicer vacuolatum DSM 3385]|uniref:Elp3/MiaA/NifB-like radical SAM core domain-containing protein n=1 Tax=Desulfocicer vacuolatum DSM 3385 TaxID=1121400 RepID=A0A1W2D578_9BACT|nr:radical SAM protein [Desulfocicer vacuolatum]SMC92657.1 hypothetical protein SAMN02746065_11586 [Desulfocicer vacuolatum DSM 3385]
MPHLTEKLRSARKLSWKFLGPSISFHIPGMFHYEGVAGKYPAMSITGKACSLQCDHCKGKLLESMIGATSPSKLLEKAMVLAEKGNHGILISGGCDAKGRLPWDRFAPAIETIKKETGLFVSVHSGIIDTDSALGLKAAGVDQALVDVIGDDGTYERIYGLPFGVSKIVNTLEALANAGIDIIPHIVCGLDYGRIKGEREAINIVSRFNTPLVVIVSVMALGAEWKKSWKMPKAEEVAEIIADTRFAMPKTPISLGCARERGNRLMETLAIDAGVNRMAIPSEEAVCLAKEYGLSISYHPTCCSVMALTSGTEVARQDMEST